MVDRNTIVGVDFLTIGFLLAALGFIWAQSVPITAFGFALLIIGALVILIVPEPIPQDAYKSLLKDSITNIEIILEESQLKERAYFSIVGEQIRAFVPISQLEESKSYGAKSFGQVLLQSFSKATQRFIANYSGMQGLLLVPPGNEIVRLSKVQKEDDLEESLRSVLVGFSDLASSVIAVEEGDEIKIQIANPKLLSQSTYFNQCLGSPVSCVACCVVSFVKGLPVKILDEKLDQKLLRLTLRLFK